MSARPCLRPPVREAHVNPRTIRQYVHQYLRQYAAPTGKPGRSRQQPTAFGNFLASGVFELKEKLGVLLWQFPGSFRFDAERFEHFFALLPRDTQAALDFAREHHDERVAGRSTLTIDRKRPLRHAIEVRHESFLCEAFIDLLRRHRISLVFAHSAGKWPYAEDVTTDFVYLRLHGSEQMYHGSYPDDVLAHWAGRIAAWHGGDEPADAHHIGGPAPKPRGKRDVFCYFDNDVKVRAPFDARRLMARLGLDAHLPPLPEYKGKAPRPLNRPEPSESDPDSNPDSQPKSQRKSSPPSRRAN
ncbi:DUF72 domain-containing protein [Paraburkholderia kururiensis]|uniref:DUF72 domain-containing protein n=1 Tax=Paraburkholderia kururiensis TaxID=984307 RepID=A0ABZ0WKL3_9BURK|nr:DUF72 domain-containing protein [Paraburkholderia kururiensis]WQD77888.1 DUF72 domain-containing protein [Paraburkholderia kururiensis]